MARPRYVPRPRVHTVHRNPLVAFPPASLLSQVREHTEAGEMVRVCAYGLAFYYIVRNGRMYLALPAEGSPIGSFENIAAALLAGDKHVAAGKADDLPPRGAA